MLACAGDALRKAGRGNADRLFHLRPGSRGFRGVSFFSAVVLLVSEATIRDVMSSHKGFIRESDLEKLLAWFSVWSGAQARESHRGNTCHT